MRIGIGYDIHELVWEKDLILGGVKIPSKKGLLGHSDADVLIHAIIDAIFGALALRDIGYHFPDSDSKYENISSMKLLEATAQMIEGHKIINIDSNIICQKPKLSPYIDAMRENIAKVLNIDINQVSIKAKTNENLDSMGENRSIAVNAVVLIEEKY